MRNSWPSGSATGGRSVPRLRYEQIAADREIDAVIIATPNDTHRPIALACIAAGKHVMCEKPLGLDFDEARDMYRAARDKNVRHMTAFTYRFAPSMRYLKHLVVSGRWARRDIFAASGFSTCPRQVGAGGN